MDNEKLQNIIDERIKKLVPEILKGSAFTDRKLTDMPNDNLSVTSRRYVNLNGTVANRPASSIATIGQSYFATDTNIPMTWNGANWVNGVSSVVA